MNADAEQQSLDLVRAIARRIRQLRLDKGWTLEKLADVTGLSKSYLSQVENGAKNPPISTLIKIAFGLSVGIIELIDGKQNEFRNARLSLVRREERRPITDPDVALRYRNMHYESVNFRKTDRIMDAYIVTVGPKFPPEQFTHDGQELAFMLEGRQEFVYDGQSILVEAGDCLYFDSNRPHTSRSIDDRPSKVLVVFSNLRRGE